MAQLHRQEHLLGVVMPDRLVLDSAGNLFMVDFTEGMLCFTGALRCVQGSQVCVSCATVCQCGSWLSGLQYASLCPVDFVQKFCIVTIALVVIRIVLTLSRTYSGVPLQS